MKKMHFNELAAMQEDRFQKIKERRDGDVWRSGEMIEAFTIDLFEEFGYKAEKYDDRKDLLFGADMKLSWVGEDGWHYSLHVDITSGKKKGVKWLDYNGTHKNSHSFYGGENFSAYYGLKEVHPIGFKYQTPVYVMRVENKWLRDTTAYHQEFAFAIQNLKRLHMESERPKRASMMIHVPEYLLQGGF